MSVSARKRAEAFPVERTIEQVKGLYHYLLEKSGGKEIRG
jgi:hypothetical protein